jgi:hypothetical protein
VAEKNDLTSLAKRLEEVLDRLGDEQLETLEVLRQIQILSQALLRREAARLRRKLGEDHPRVRRVETLAEQSRTLVNDLEIELEVARIEVPKVEEGSGPAAGQWTVHGRVTDEQGEGLPGLLVRIFDKDRRYDDELGVALTDKNGWFTVTTRDWACWRTSTGHGP